MEGAFLAIACALFAVGGGSRAPRTALVVVGADPIAAAQVQADFESRLGAAGAPAALIDLGTLGQRIGENRRAGAAADPVVDALLADLARAYYDARYKQMLDDLDKIEARDPLPAERIKAALWRATVLLALNDPEDARTQVEEAVAIAPELKADAKVFPPPVLALIAEAKKSVQRRMLDIRGLPRTAVVKVDDREVPARGEIPLGAHRLSVTAPGLVPVDRRLDVAAGAGALVVPVPMTLALGSAQSLTLASSYRGQTPPGLDRLAESAGADVLVVVSEVGTPPDSGRALVWWRTDGRSEVSAARPATAEGFSAILDFVSRSLAAGAPSLRDAGWRIAMSAGLRSVLRVRTLSGRQANNVFVASFSGIGPQLSAIGGHGRLGFGADVGLVGFGMSHARLVLPDQPTSTTQGGSLFHSRLWAGYALPIGAAGERQWLTLIPGGEIRVESLRQHDLGGLGLLPSYRYGGTWAKLEADTHAALGSADARFAGWFSIELIPLSRFEESPSGTTGTGPQVSGSDLGFSVDVAGARRWTGGIAFEQLGRTIAYGGSVQAPVDPALTHAKVGETDNMILLTIRRGF